MTPFHFSRIGRLLYGTRWQSDYARALGITPRHCRRLIAGESKIGPNIRMAVRKLLRERSADCDTALAGLSGEDE